jgi:hypothetical protein
MLHRAKVALCPEINTEHTNCGQKVQFLIVKPVCASSYQQTLKGLDNP